MLAIGHGNGDKTNDPHQGLTFYWNVGNAVFFLVVKPGFDFLYEACWPGSNKSLAAISYNNSTAYNIATYNFDWGTKYGIDNNWISIHSMGVIAPLLAK